MINLTKNIFEWLLFIGSLSLFYFNFWIGILVHNILMCLFTFKLHKWNLFNPKHSSTKIILPPLIFGFFGVIASIILFGKDKNTTSSKIQKSSFPKFIHDYDYALKGENGFFNLQDDVINKHLLTKIESDDLMIPLFKRFENGEIELYEQTGITATEGLFRFQYDVSLFNPEDEFSNKILFGFNSNYSSEGLFRLGEDYVKTRFGGLLSELQNDYNESELNFEIFYEGFMEENIEREEWCVPSINDYIRIVNSYDTESHIPIWVSSHFEETYSPHRAIFPVEIIEHGYVKSCGFDLFYREV